MRAGRRLRRLWGRSSPLGEKSASMTFRLDAELHAAFLAACRRQDRPAAQELRAFMRAYVERDAEGGPLGASGAPAAKLEPGD